MAKETNSGNQVDSERASQALERLEKQNRLLVRALLIAIFLVAVLAVSSFFPGFRERLSSGNIRTKKVADLDASQLASTKQLTDEDRTLLGRRLARRIGGTLLGALSGSSTSAEQLRQSEESVGQAIDEERQYEEEHKIQEKADSARMQLAKAEVERQRLLLSQALTVTVYEKIFLPSSYEAGRYDDQTEIRVAYESHSQKDIRGFEGTLVFKDLFGDVIKKIHLKEDEPLKAGSKKRQTFFAKYNQFIDNDKLLANTQLENIHVEWQPETILFSDGSSMKISDTD